MPETVIVPAFRINQRKHSAIILRLMAKDLARISYVAARRVSTEKNAVQRILTRSRIAGINEFAQNGGDFPASVVLNWVNKDHRIRLKGGSAWVPLEPSSAQLLDGQHRVEGLREAMKSAAWVKKLELPVAIYENLSAQECADIFLSINTEQRPVSRNLVIDLYGIASPYIRDDDALAARKIVDELNTRAGSPYKGMVRYPGPSKSKGGVALSSMVSVLKPLLAMNGVFDQVGVPAEKAEERVKIILNWLKVIRSAYGTQWSDKSNVFRYAAGFWGAMDFLSTKLLLHCNIEGSFEESTMRKAMKGLKDSLIWQSDVSGMQGRKSAHLISGVLNEVFSANVRPRKSIKV